MDKTVETTRGERASTPTRGLPTISTFLFLVLALAFLVFLATRFDIDLSEMWAQIKHSNPVLYSIGFALYYVSFLVRGMRWRVIIQISQPPGSAGGRLPSVLECSQFILLGRFADSVAWLRMGNIYRAYLASHSFRGSFPRTVGTLVAEHFLDMLVVVTALVGLGLFVAGGLSLPLSGAIAVALAVVTAAAAVLLLMRRFGPALEARLPGRLGEVYQHFHRGTLGGLKPTALPLLLALSVTGWLCAVGRWHFVLAAVGISVSLPMLLFVSLLNALLAAVPLTPGGLGVVEPGVVGVLTLSLSPEQALSVTLLERSISYLGVIVVGGLLLFGREIVRKRHSSRRSSTSRAGQPESTINVR